MGAPCAVRILGRDHAPGRDGVDPLPRRAWVYAVLPVEVFPEQRGPKRLEVRHGLPHGRARMLRKQVQSRFLVGPRPAPVEAEPIAEKLQARSERSH